jgi:hypothetical protein
MCLSTELHGYGPVTSVTIANVMERMYLGADDQALLMLEKIKQFYLANWWYGCIPKDVLRMTPEKYWNAIRRAVLSQDSSSRARFCLTPATARSQWRWRVLTKHDRPMSFCKLDQFVVNGAYVVT